MNTFATIGTKLIASFLLLAFVAAADLSAQPIVAPGEPSELADLPLVFNMDTDEIDWEGYTMFPFEGAALERIPNPDQSEGNTTDYVLRYVKAAGQPWAGFFYHTDGPMEMTEDSKFSLNVWSPVANINALLKLEMRQFPDVNTGDMFVNIPVANEWTRLEWDLSGVDRDTPYDRVVIIMDLQGPPGTGGDRFTWFLDDFAFMASASSTEGTEGTTLQPISLSQNYPNPFSSQTNITFSLATPGHAVVEVFDVYGKRVSTLVNEVLPAGRHATVLTASDLASGMYVYRLQVGDQVESKRFVVIGR
jgi:hypothetical protein